MRLRNSDKVMILLRLLSSWEIPSRGQIYKQQTTYAGALLSTRVLPGICVSVCRIRASASPHIHGIYTTKLNLFSLSEPLSCSWGSSQRKQPRIPTPNLERTTQSQAGSRGAEMILQSVFVMGMQQKVCQEVVLINRNLEI